MSLVERCWTVSYTHLDVYKRQVYGNVNVNYSYCKSVAQLKSAADYILGRRKEQVEDGCLLYTSSVIRILKQGKKKMLLWNAS